MTLTLTLPLTKLAFTMAHRNAGFEFQFQSEQLNEYLQHNVNLYRIDN